MVDKNDDIENGKNFESYEEFDINAPHYSDDSSHDLDGDFESVPDMDDNAETIDVLNEDPSMTDYSFENDPADFESDFDEGWEEDGDDFAATRPNNNTTGGLNEKLQRNWLNIGVVGVLAVAVIGGAVMFLSGGDDVPQQVVVAQNDNDNLSSASDNNQVLAQQAISGNGNLGTQSLLDNPELLGATAMSDERPDPEARDNEIFQALNNQPATTMSDDDMNDIFAAMENMQGTPTQPQAGIDDLQGLRPMPQPSDNAVASTYDDTFLANINDIPFDDDITVTTPRTPQVTENPVFDETPAVATAVTPVVEETLPAAEPELTVAPTQTQPVDVPVSTAQTEAMDQKLTDLNNRLDQFAARLESIATKLDNAPTATTTNAATPDMGEMEKVISRLESKIADLEKQKAAPAPRAAAPKKAAAPAPKRATPPAQKTVQWELRGATPEKAFVAERGTQNLRTVSVGDTLPSIGRITAITQQSGRWVVQGSNGRITQ